MSEFHQLANALRAEPRDEATLREEEVNRRARNVCKLTNDLDIPARTEQATPYGAGEVGRMKATSSGVLMRIWMVI